MQAYSYSFNSYRSEHPDTDVDSLLEAWMTHLEEPTLFALEDVLKRAVRSRSPTLSPYKDLIDLARYIFLAEGKASLFPADLDDIRKVLGLLREINFFIMRIRAGMIEIPCSLSLSRVWKEGYKSIELAAHHRYRHEWDHDFIARNLKKKGE
jgi:hypothetical protein